MTKGAVSMTAKEIIRKALSRSGMSQTSLSEKLGYSNKTAVGAILGKNNSLRTDVLFKWLDAMGFEIVIRKKNGNKSEEWTMTEESENDMQAEIDAIRSTMKPPVRME